MLQLTKVKKPRIMFVSKVKPVKNTGADENMKSWHRFLMLSSEGVRRLVCSIYDLGVANEVTFNSEKFVCAKCIEHGECRSLSTFTGIELLSVDCKCPKCGSEGEFIPKEFAI